MKTSLRMELLVWEDFVFSESNAPTCFIASTTNAALLIVLVGMGTIWFCTGDLRGLGLPDRLGLHTGGGLLAEPISLSLLEEAC